MQWIVRMVSIPTPGGSPRQDAMTIPRSSIITPALLALLALLMAIAIVPGCATRDRLHRPATIVARHPAVLAVGPMFNESGVSIPADQLASVSDKLVAAINGVEGWSSVPFNRTLQAMKQLGLDSIRTDEDARTLCEVVGVDGILVGTVTAWNPYDPPRFGANLLLVPASDEATTAVDPSTLYGRTGDSEAAAGSRSAATLSPVAITVDLDAVDHAVRADLRRYAKSHLDVTGGFDPPERYYLMVYARWLNSRRTWSSGIVILDDMRTAVADVPSPEIPSGVS